jgi:hypothetical protein
VGRPIRAAISKAERTLLFIRCTLLWVDGNHMEFTRESQQFSEAHRWVLPDVI